jgi:glycerol kinase
MQFQADLLGVDVEVAAEQETTALGVAALAAGYESGVRIGRVYDPRRSRDEVATLRAAWRNALDLTRSS